MYLKDIQKSLEHLQKELTYHVTKEQNLSHEYKDQEWYFCYERLMSHGEWLLGYQWIVGCSLADAFYTLGHLSETWKMPLRNISYYPTYEEAEDFIERCAAQYKK